MHTAKADAARGRLTEEVVDYREARTNVLSVIQGKKFFTAEVPKWTEAANAWRHFLTDVTRKDFGEIDMKAQPAKNVVPSKDNT